MADIPTNEPVEVTQGTTLQWRREDLTADYPASTWTLTYALVGPAGAQTITATADGDHFAITVSSTDSADWQPGRYEWAAYVSDGSIRKQVDSGTLTVQPDLAALPAGYDNRSHARKVLDSIRAVIEGRATKDQESYSINGRSLSRTPLDQLLALEKHYQGRVATEDRKAKIQAGERPRSRVLVRFTG